MAQARPGLWAGSESDMAPRACTRGASAEAAAWSRRETDAKVNADSPERGHLARLGRSDRVSGKMPALRPREIGGPDSKRPRLG